MNTINWSKEVHIRQEALIKDLQGLLQIRSVLEEENATKEAPLGQGVKDALLYMLKLGERDGFEGKNVHNIAGHLQFSAGQESVGILCHVDVVPEGDGWKSDPYGAEIRDGKIYARGALDDKGPTIAAYYAMKIVKDLNLPLSKQVRMIIGTDEESNWRCVDTYFKEEEMPTLGFAPDADFPIIYAEKGIADIDIVQKPKNPMNVNQAEVVVQSFSSGRRYNMVPDYAKAVLTIKEDDKKVIQTFESYLSGEQLIGCYKWDEKELVLEVEGVSAHGLEPENGVNAGLMLSKFLRTLSLDDYASAYFSFVDSFFVHDSRGKKLGIAYHDDMTGDLTINVGILTFSNETGGKVGLTMRYPVTTEFNETKAQLNRIAKEHSFEIAHFSNSKPHYVDKDSQLIQTLSTVYKEQTGEEATLLSIGGGTYARSLEKGVAFGPLFPEREDIAHKKDEYMYLEDLFKATAIYAQAIYELAK